MLRGNQKKEREKSGRQHANMKPMISWESSSQARDCEKEEYVFPPVDWSPCMHFNQPRGLERNSFAKVQDRNVGHPRCCHLFLRRSSKDSILEGEKSEIKERKKEKHKIEVKHIEKGGRSQNWPSSCKRFPSQAAKIGFLGPKLNRQNTAKAHDRFDPTEINEVDPRQQAENWIAT